MVAIWMPRTIYLRQSKRGRPNMEEAAGTAARSCGALAVETLKSCD